MDATLQPAAHTHRQQILDLTILWIMGLLYTQIITGQVHAAPHAPV